jgi:hypothetical protein
VRALASLLVVLTLSACGGGGASTSGKTFHAEKTKACLERHKALTMPADVGQFLPHGFRPRPTAALQLGFPLAHGAQALDHGSIVFDRDPATARLRYDEVLDLQFASARNVEGIPQEQAKAQIRRELSTTGNVVVSWGDPPQQASVTTVQNCLR